MFYYHTYRACAYRTGKCARYIVYVPRGLSAAVPYRMAEISTTLITTRRRTQLNKHTPAS